MSIEIGQHVTGIVDNGRLVEGVVEDVGIWYSGGKTIECVEIIGDRGGHEWLGPEQILAAQ